MGLPFIVREMSFGNFLKRSTADSLHRKDHAHTNGKINRTSQNQRSVYVSMMIQHDPTVDRFLLRPTNSSWGKLGHVHAYVESISSCIYIKEKKTTLHRPGDAVAVHVECLQVVEPSTNGQL